MYTVKTFENWEDKHVLQLSYPHLFYTAEWFQTLKDAYNFNVEVLLNDNKFNLAFTQIEDVKGKRIVVLPFSDYTPSNGLAAEDYNQILNFFNNEFPDFSINLKTELDYNSPIQANISRKAVRHIIPIDEPDTIHRSDSFVRNTRKARELGMTHRINKDRRALRDFYRLYHQYRFRKFNSIPQPFRFFEAIHSNFIQKGKGVVLEVLDEKKVIASSVILQHHDTLYYKFGCSAEDQMDEVPNSLLFSEMINYAKSKKFKKIDLGLSGLSSSFDELRQWKEDIGGVAHPISYWEDRSENSDQEREDKVMKNLRKLTNAMIQSNLNPKQTSAFSEKIYSLFA